MPRTEADRLDRIEELLTVLAKRALLRTMQEQLTDESLRKLYGLTGTGTVKQLATKTGMSTGKISGLWKKWEEAGLIAKEGNQYRKIV